MPGGPDGTKRPDEAKPCMQVTMYRVDCARPDVHSGQGDVLWCCEGHISLIYGHK